MSAAEVDVVIVSYHSRDLVLACLDSLDSAAAGLSYAVTVVDNDSADGLGAAIAARRDGTAFVAMGHNAGFSRANNRGIALGSAPFVLVLNPDTVVGPGALRALVEFAERHPSTGVVAPQLLNADGTPQLTARAFPTPAAGVFGRRSALTRRFPGNRWSRRFLTERSRPVGDRAAYEVDWVSGAAMLVPRPVVEQTGGFDEGFFMFWEDADWCHRIKSSGFGVWCLPSATVVHDEGGTRQHGWSPRGIQRFHAGAYRYWTKHHAPQPWNPLRWAAAVLLAARAAALIVHSYIDRPNPTGSQPAT